jgi:YcxB-like protein
VHIVIDAQPDPARYSAAFRHLMRRGMVRVRIVGVVVTLLVLGVVALDAYRGEPFEALALPLLILGLGLALVLPMRGRQVSLRALPEAFRQPSRIELTEQSVRISSPLFHTEYAWGAFVRSVELPGQVLLMLSARQFVSVPTDRLDPAQLYQLRQFLANRQFARV